MKQKPEPQCPYIFVDPAILPLVTLLNRLGVETVWSCAGYGVSRSRVEPPISRLPVKIRKLVQFDGYDHYVEEKDHVKTNIPYVVVRDSDYHPKWFNGVISYLNKVKIRDSDLYTDRFSAYFGIKLVEVSQSENDEINIHMSQEASAIIMEIADIPVCKDDIVTIKKMWIHEMVKAFSFI